MLLCHNALQQDHNKLLFKTPHNQKRYQVWLYWTCFIKMVSTLRTATHQFLPWLFNSRPVCQWATLPSSQICNQSFLQVRAPALCIYKENLTAGVTDNTVCRRMKVLIYFVSPQNSNEDHPVKMLLSFHSHMLNIALILDSVKFFITIKVWADTISA